MKILLVDDEPAIERLVSGLVADAGYEFAYAEDGLAALEAAKREKPDLVIMDVMMPRMDGFASCAELRRRGCTVPVIFLSAKGDIVDKGVGFQSGGDDYLVKPFDPRELLMHIEAQLRRASMAAAGPAAASATGALRVGRFSLDAGQHLATKDGARLSLTPKEFKILFALASSPGLVLSKEQLVEAAWGREFVGETTSITVFIKKLREKVEDDPSDPRVILTVWGIGYRLDPEACS
ncbi:response regulator transcription factor [Rubneribacter sp.]